MVQGSSATLRADRTLYITADKSEGDRHHSKLNVHVQKTGEVVDLRQPSP